MLSKLEHLETRQVSKGGDTSHRGRWCLQYIRWITIIKYLCSIWPSIADPVTNGGVIYIFIMYNNGTWTFFFVRRVGKDWEFVLWLKKASVRLQRNVNAYCDMPQILKLRHLKLERSKKSFITSIKSLESPDLGDLWKKK